MPSTEIAIPQRRPKPISDDPFDPLGVRFGSFLLRPAIELTTGYSTNPGAVHGGAGSSLYIVAPELLVRSDWERHELSATIRGSYSEYPSVPVADRPNLDAKIDGRVDVSTDTRIDLEGRFLLSTDYPGSPNLPAGIAKLPIYYDFGTTVGIDQRFDRLDLSLKGIVDRVEYQDSLLTDGSTSSNHDRDYEQFGAQLRAGYEITPGVKPFVELDAYARTHDLAVDRDGYARDSTGIEPQVGTAFEFTRMLTGEISLGYLAASYKDPRLPEVSGLMVNGSLLWAMTGLTNLKFTATSTPTESTLPGVSAALQRGAELDVDHALRRWLVVTGKVGVSYYDYVGNARVDQRYFASVGLVYKLSPIMQLRGELRQDWLHSNVPGVDCAATSFLVGMRLQR